VIKPKRPSPTESPLRFEIDPEPLAETLTAWGGVPLVVQAFRSPTAGAEFCCRRELGGGLGAGLLI
jgi:hypothetical protein